ncbi:MAG: hypothetical protein ACREWG_12525 [Gammaproteobacteria bacterium]
MLAADGSEPHVQPGNHIRVNAHPLLGLPVAPFVIWRAVARDRGGVSFRTNALFVDSQDQVLTPPFQLRLDNPVTVRIPLIPGQRCIWAQVSADPLNVAPTTTVASLREPGGARNPAPVTTRARLNAAHVGLGRSVAGLRAAVTPENGMVAKCYVTSARGLTPIGRRDERPFAFSAPGIIEIRLTGSAAVDSFLWIEANDFPNLDFEPWGMLTLPHQGGPCRRRSAP